MDSDKLVKLLRQKALEAVGAYVFSESKDEPDNQLEVVENEKSVPASAMARTDEGLVLVLDPAILYGKKAADLRARGMIVPVYVPDVATVVRESDGSLVYKWCESGSDKG